MLISVECHYHIPEIPNVPALEPRRCPTTRPFPHPPIWPARPMLGPRCHRPPALRDLRRIVSDAAFLFRLLAAAFNGEGGVRTVSSA